MSYLQENKLKFETKIINEIQSMVEFTMSRGKAVPPTVIAHFEKEISKEDSQKDLEQLISIHHELAKKIAPALPRSVAYLSSRENILKKKHHFYHFKYPAVRNILIFSLISITVLILTGMTNPVNGTTLAKGILHSKGFPLLMNFIYLSASASIGASFYILSNYHTRFKDGTYHPDQDVENWVLIILGVIGGIILSQLIPIDIEKFDQKDNLFHLNREIFALLGGFSSKFIYTILNKIICSYQMVFSNEKEIDLIKSIHQEKELIQDELHQMKIKSIVKINRVKNEIKTNDIPELVQTKILESVYGIEKQLGIRDI